MAAGIVVFLIVEKIVRFVEDFSGGEHSGTHGHHHHHHRNSKEKKDDNVDEKSSQKASKEKVVDGAGDATSNAKQVAEPQSELRKVSSEGSREYLLYMTEIFVFCSICLVP